MYEKLEPCYVRIQIALHDKNMKQSELVKITGLPKSAISQYVAGKHEPTQTPTYLIAKALDVSEAWLMGYDVPKTRGERIKTVVTPDEKSLLDKYAELSDEKKTELLKYLDYLLHT